MDERRRWIATLFGIGMLSALIYPLMSLEEALPRHQTAYGVGLLTIVLLFALFAYRSLARPDDESVWESIHIKGNGRFFVVLGYVAGGSIIPFGFLFEYMLRGSFPAALMALTAYAVAFGIWLLYALGVLFRPRLVCENRD